MATIAELEQQVADLEAQIVTLEAEKAELTLALNKCKKENTMLKKRVKALEAKLKKALNPTDDDIIRLITDLPDEAKTNLSVKIRTTEEGIKSYMAFLFGITKEKPVRRNVQDMTKVLLESERTMQ